MHENGRKRLANGPKLAVADEFQDLGAAALCFGAAERLGGGPGGPPEAQRGHRGGAMAPRRAAAGDAEQGRGLKP